MLKPRDDLRKDYRLMEFNGVVNRFLQDAPETRRRRLYIRTYSVLPLNEECGLIEWVPNLVGLRPILVHIYKQKGTFYKLKFGIFSLIIIATASLTQFFKLAFKSNFFFIIFFLLG